MPRLSVVIPAYNEARTLGEIVARIRAGGFAHEIIVADDSPTDATTKTCLRLHAARQNPLIRHPPKPAHLTDEATGYKVVRAALLRELDLRADGFEFCPELTAKLLRHGAEIVEVPISYRPRTRADGKKIRWRDGVIAIWTLLKLRFR